MAGIAAGKLTRAVPVAKLTVAVTPSSLLSFFSTRAAHEAQVIPPMVSSTARTAPPGAAAGLAPVTTLIRASPLPSRCYVQPGPFGKKISRPNGPGTTLGLRLDLATRHDRQAACSVPASW